MGAVERDFIKAVRREYRRRRAAMEPEVRAALAAAPAGTFADFDLAMGVAVSQNVLRNCMEIVLGQAMPQGRDFFVEIAVRLACYAITALPADDQEVAAMFVRDGLLEKLGHMQAQGFGIQTEWSD